MWFLRSNRKCKSVLLTASIFFLLPFSYNCIDKPLTPKAPSWDTQLTIPLLERTYHFADLITKDSARFVTVNNELVYRPSKLDNKPSPIKIQSLSPVSALFNRQLGIIPLTAVTLPGLDLSFQDLTGQSPPALPWPGPEISTNQNRELISDTASYDYIIYEQGAMTITVTNTFNFDVTFAPGGIQLVDTTVVPNVILGTFTIGAIAQNGSAQSTISLDREKVGSLLRMKFQFQTVNMTGKTINAGKISAAISITKDGTPGSNPTLAESKMKLLSAFYVPVTSIQDSVHQMDNAPVPVAIKDAEFTSGDFDIVINNAIPFDVIVGFNLREFVNKNTNQSFKLIDQGTKLPSDSVTIAGGQNYTMNVQMKDYKLEARRANGGTDTLTSGIHFSLNIKTLVQSSTKKVIKKTDSVLVEIRPEQIAGVNQPYVIDKVNGKIPPTDVNINQSVSAGIGSSTDKFSADSIKFDGAQIILKIFTKSLFPTDLKFDVIGISDGVLGQKLSTPVGTGKNSSPDGVSYRIFRGDTAKIIFDKDHADANGKTIDQFLSSFVKNGKFSFPDSFRVTGLARLEPQDAYNADSIGFVQNNDSVFTSLEFSFPLKIGIMNGSYKDTASIAANVSDTAQINLIKEGKVYFDVLSTFPVGIDVRTKLLQADPLDSTKASSNVVLILDTLSIAGDGSPNRSGVQSFTFMTLTGDQAVKLNQAKFTAMDLRLGTALNNGSTAVSFRRTDSIVVKSFANIKFNVDLDRLNNKK